MNLNNTYSIYSEKKFLVNPAYEIKLCKKNADYLQKLPANSDKDNKFFRSKSENNIKVDESSKRAKTQSLDLLSQNVLQETHFKSGGCNHLYNVQGNYGYIIKPGITSRDNINKNIFENNQSPSALEAAILFKLEKLGLNTVYESIKNVAKTDNPTLYTPRVILRKIQNGISSKQIIGTQKRPLDPTKYAKRINENTMADLNKIKKTMNEKKLAIGDFQFIVDEKGFVFINDPTSLNSKFSKTQSKLPRETAASERMEWTINKFEELFKQNKEI